MKKNVMKKIVVWLSTVVLSASIFGAPLSDSPDSPYRTIGHTIYLSGVPGGSIEVDDPQAEVTEALNNLKAAAVVAGGNINDIVKMTVYMVDANDDYTVLNQLTPQYFSAPYPARSPVGVASLPGGKRIEIDAVMIKRIPQSR